MKVICHVLSLEHGFILHLYRKSILFKTGEKNVNLKDEGNLFSSGNIRKMQLQNVRKGIALLAQPVAQPDRITLCDLRAVSVGGGLAWRCVSQEWMRGIFSVLKNDVRSHLEVRRNKAQK